MTRRRDSVRADIDLPRDLHRSQVALNRKAGMIASGSAGIVS